MMKLKMVIAIMFAILVASCATMPPGKLKESDFLSREIVLDITVSKAFDQLHQGLRFCGPSSGGVVFVTHHGVPQCTPVRDDGSVLCDMFIGSADGGRSGAVLGRIELNRSGTGTLAILRVQTYAANKDKILKSWEMFLHGHAKDVCPED